MELLAEVKKIDQNLPVILVTAFGSVSMAVEALKERGLLFLRKSPIF